MHPETINIIYFTICTICTCITINTFLQLSQLLQPAQYSQLFIYKYIITSTSLQVHHYNYGITIIHLQKNYTTFPFPLRIEDSEEKP